MKKIIVLFIKYKLYLPWLLFRFIYYNLIRISRSNKKAILFLTRYSILDISKSAEIILSHPVIFGWCNMRKSKIETGLCMGDFSSLKFIGKGITHLGYGSYIQIGNHANLQLGNTFINREVKIICNKNITIGNDCIIAMGTVIRDNDGGNHRIISPDYTNSKPITIGNHVWIGENVMILKGVTIGDGAIIGAGSLVTKDIPPRCLALGSPAKVIRENIEWKA